MLLNKGNPIINYKDYKPSFNFFELKKNPNKHWTDMAESEIWQACSNQVLPSNKYVIQATKFVVLTCDEVITLDN